MRQNVQITDVDLTLTYTQEVEVNIPEAIFVHRAGGKDGKAGALVANKVCESNVGFEADAARDARAIQRWLSRALPYKTLDALRALLQGQPVEGEQP